MLLVNEACESGLSNSADIFFFQHNRTTNSKQNGTQHFLSSHLGQVQTAQYDFRPWRLPHKADHGRSKAPAVEVQQPWDFDLENIADQWKLNVKAACDILPWDLLMDIAEHGRTGNWSRSNSNGRSFGMRGILGMKTSSPLAVPHRIVASITFWRITRKVESVGIL